MKKLTKKWGGIFEFPGNFILEKKIYFYNKTKLPKIIHTIIQYHTYYTKGRKNTTINMKRGIEKKVGVATLSFI